MQLEGLGQLKMGEIRNVYKYFLRKYTTQTTLQTNIFWDVTMEMEDIY
jgi:hypothetical protein